MMKLFARAVASAVLFAGCADPALEGAGPFYRASVPEGAPHGTLVRAEEVAPLAANARSYRVLYTSLALDGGDVLVSGMVTVPNGPVPEGGYDVVSWAHGTIGLSDECVPSNGFTANHDIYAITEEITAEGWIAVATDYEGLGTAGVHPYLVGESEARSTLDIIRAASGLESAALSGRFAVWGRSQGGHAALFTAQIAAEYTPELELVGTVAAAPASDLVFIGSYGAALPGSRGFVWQMLLGMTAAYPELRLEDIMSEAALTEMNRLRRSGACHEGWSEAAVAFEDPGIVSPITEHPEWMARVEASSPGEVLLAEPVLMIQGTADTVVRSVLSSALARRMCELGTTLDYRLFEGQSHNDSTALHMPEIRGFTRDRFAGVQAVSTCAP